MKYCTKRSKESNVEGVEGVRIHCTDFNALNAMYVSKVLKIHCTDFNALNTMCVSKVSKIHCTDFNALNAMYVVEGVKDTLYRFQCIKCYVCVEGVEDTLYRFQCIKCYVCQRRRRWCLWLLHNTVCRVQVSCQRCQRYSVYSGPSPRQEGRLVVAVPSVLWVQRFTTMQSEEAALYLNVLGLVKLQG